MKGAGPFSLPARLASMRCAARGLVDLLASEHNARVHAAATLAVVVAGLLLRVTAVEWALLVGAMALVWTAEALNAAVERLADVVRPGQDAGVGRAKDLAAGGVLASAIGAALIGLLVFVPRLLAWLSRA
jgi:diacylglycerol kinase (ATP)